MKVPVSVVVITYNEADRIQQCLASLSWADEIIVIDSFSSDGTVLLCRNYTDTILFHAWEGYAKQRNAGFDCARHEWVLFIDADECVTPALAMEIQTVFSGSAPLCSGFRIPRRAFYWGKQIRYGEWGCETKLRLVRKSVSRWAEDKNVHEELYVQGEVQSLQAPLYHFTNRNFYHHLRKTRYYSLLFARDAFLARKKFAFPIIFVAPVMRFMNGYIRLQGFRDGIRGLVIALMQSLDVFLRYSKIYLLYAGIMRIPRQ
ncbi:MAG TPA: glycosyltransferase family 2 protein [Candidatus Omnitrophota bacterium]|mgnify:CR=1 FL=1|nr:glycosyltransferase family 2 protein [Candidatus Omnitrophota bacterium]HPT06639.1 glycosyltransferase family 2 protein [Candidatus Omnitrophota bacterium]